MEKEKKIDFVDYYYDKRWDLLSLIPSNSKNILDIGCGKGWLGKKIKETRPCKITGIEVTSAGSYAHKIYDKVYIKSVEDIIPAFEKNSFDCIILGDVLEHLINPWSVLEQLTFLLQKKGVLVISLPNIQHYSIILALLRGNFKYQEEGIMDKTHLRFFTLSSAKEMLTESNLTSDKIYRNTSSGRKLRILNFFLKNLLLNFITFQYIFVSEKK